MRTDLLRLRRLCVVATALISAARAAEPYPLFYEDAREFTPVIRRAEESVRPLPLDMPVTGVTVPHHLLAADMIADTLRLAAKGRYRRIVVISPDHFRRGTSLCSTSLRPFKTPLGDVPVDEEAVRSLVDGTLVTESNLFSHEHGVQAVLPFLAKWFPGVPVVPLALDIRSQKPGDWTGLAVKVAKVVTPETLVIQSTDFSHYLPQARAKMKDQETLGLLACGNPDALGTLGQPEHVDSKASQWLQMTLQRQVHGISAPVVVDNRNAVRYGGKPDEPKTTSYITQVYSPRFIPAASLPGEAWYFGGDTHFGRQVAVAMKDAEREEIIRGKILAVTASRPLVVNLEGVLLEKMPPGPQHPMRIGMAAAPALAELKKLNVVAVGVANNHTLDYGTRARDEMKRMLRNGGVAVIDAGPPVAVGPLRLAAATDVMNVPVPGGRLLRESDFAGWRQRRAGSPLIALLHAGREYADTPGARERQLGDWAESAGAVLVLGSHPHRPSPAWERPGKAPRFYSMGNLLFDQSDPKNGGGLVEVRVFEQGTLTARWIPLGNLYQAASSRRDGGREE